LFGVWSLRLFGVVCLGFGVWGLAISSLSSLSSLSSIQYLVSSPPPHQYRKIPFFSEVINKVLKLDSWKFVNQQLIFRFMVLKPEKMVLVLKKGASKKEMDNLNKNFRIAIGVNTKKFCGVIKLKTSPLAIQKSFRDEWK